MNPPNIDVRLDGDVVEVRLDGEIDSSNSERTADRLIGAMPADAAGLVLDLAGIGYLDSAGVSMLFAILRRLETSRQTLALVVPEGSTLRRLFAVTRVDTLVAVRATLPEARSVLRETASDGIP